MIDVTIDEAISFCEEKASNIKLKAEPQVFIQIAKWLEELKELREKAECARCVYNCGCIDEIAYKDGYNNALDDFADRLAEYMGVENATKYGNKNAEQQRNSYDTLMKYEIADAIDDVAEQLKAGVDNE